jgi:hypothetical protein
VKFQHLAVGQKFTYQGLCYTKVSPLVANQTESGERKLIPRYADISPRHQPEASTALSSASALDLDELQRAFEQFRSACLESLEPLAGQADDTVVSAIREQVTRACDRLLQQLSINR